MARVCAFFYSLGKAPPLKEKQLITIKKKIMENVVYYSTLFFAWLVIHLLLAATLIIIGTIEGPYALGVAAIIPEVWILSVGLAMTTRSVLAKRILHKGKSFSKTVPIVLMTLGGVMVGANIVLKATKPSFE